MLKRSAATSVALALGAASLAVSTPALAGTTAPTPYTCTGTVAGIAAPTSTMNVTSTSPEATYAPNLPIENTVSIDNASRAALVSWFQAKTVTGTAVADLTVAGTVQKVTMNIPVTDVTTEGALNLKASATIPVTTPGDLAIYGGAFTTNLTVTKADGTTFPMTSTCVLAANTSAPFLGVTVVKARSAITASVSPATAGFGDTVTAAAKVTVDAGVPAGVVNFKLDDKIYSSPVATDGTASVALPNVALGSKTVAVGFAPTDNTHFEGATTTAKFNVAKTTSALTVTAKPKVKVGKVATVSVKATAPNGTVPSGKAQLTITVKGARPIIANIVLSPTGTGTARFKVAKPGKYAVKVSYLGSATHNPALGMTTFKVK